MHMEPVPLVFSTDAGKPEEHYDQRHFAGMNWPVGYQLYPYFGYTFESHLDPLFAICHIGLRWNVNSVDRGTGNKRFNKLIRLAEHYKTMYDLWVDE